MKNSTPNVEVIKRAAVETPVCLSFSGVILISGINIAKASLRVLFHVYKSLPQPCTMF